MNPKYSFITLISILSLSLCRAQKNLPYVIVEVLAGTVKGPTGTDPLLSFHHGRIITNSKDTLEGFVKLQSSYKADCVVLKVNSKDSLIPVKTIQKVKLFQADSLITQNKYFEYEQLSVKPGKLMRKIHTGKVLVYDNSLYSNEFPGDVADSVLVISNGAVIDNKKLNESPRLFLIDFVNQTFKQNLQRKEFRERKDIIMWLNKHDF